MNRYLALSITHLFHPIFMPLVGVLFILHTDSYIAYLPQEVKRIILLVVAANTIAIPLLMLPLFHRFRVIKSYSMLSNHERVVPITFTLIPYAFTVYFLMKLPIPQVIAIFMLGAVFAIFLALIVTIWWKISIHMVGIGGLVGFFIAFSVRLQSDVTLILSLAVIVSGIIASARLSLNRHNPLQIYSGFLLGLLCLLLTVLV